jgi:hypothetical protein
VKTERQGRESGRLQGFSRGRNLRKRIPVLRKSGFPSNSRRAVKTERQGRESGRLQGFSRGRNLRKRIPVLRTRSGIFARPESAQADSGLAH